MTWDGYPQGTVTIYLDGEPVGTKTYDAGNDDGSPAATSFAMGFRPNEWAGEQTPSGELVPTTSMALADGGILVDDVRLYPTALPADELPRS